MMFDNSTRLRDAAVKVASAFLARNEGLTESVVKIAQEQMLNPDQTRRVCERANHLVNAAMRKQASTVDFDLADAAEVGRRLGAVEKIATRYFEPAAGVLEKTANDDEGKRKKDDDDEEDEDKKTVKKRESEAEESRKEARDKLAHQELVEAGIRAQGAYEDAQEGFFEAMMKTAYDGGDLGETMEAIAGYAPLAAQPHAMVAVAKLVKAAHLTRFERPLSFTPRTLEILHSEEELQKVASEVDPDLVNPGLQVSGSPVTFIRGKHAIWTSVDTLLDAYCSALCAHDAVARARLKPDHTRPAPMRTVSITHGGGGREYSVAGRNI